MITAEDLDIRVLEEALKGIPEAYSLECSPKALLNALKAARDAERYEVLKSVLASIQEDIHKLVENEPYPEAVALSGVEARIRGWMATNSTDSAPKTGPDE